jgi:hypothetical protein
MVPVLLPGCPPCFLDFTRFASPALPSAVAGLLSLVPSWGWACSWGCSCSYRADVDSRASSSPVKGSMPRPSRCSRKCSRPTPTMWNCCGPWPWSRSQRQTANAAPRRCPTQPRKVVKKIMRTQENAEKEATNRQRDGSRCMNSPPSTGWPGVCPIGEGEQPSPRRDSLAACRAPPLPRPRFSSVGQPARRCGGRTSAT